MATKTLNESVLRTKMISQNGKSYELSIERPKEDLTDTEYYNAMCRIVASNAIKPDGTPLKTISSMKLIDKEETVFDLDALSAN